MQKSGVVQYLPTDKLLMHYLVNDVGVVMYGIWGVEVNVLLGSMLHSCDLTEHGSHLLWLTREYMFLSRMHVEVRAGHTHFGQNEDKLPVFFLIVTKKMLFYTRVRCHTISCSTLTT